MKLYYKYGSIQSMPNSKYTFYYFKIVDANNNSVNHELNDSGTLPLKQADKEIDRRIRKCKKLLIPAYNGYAPGHEMEIEVQS